LTTLNFWLKLCPMARKLKLKKDDNVITTECCITKAAEEHRRRKIKRRVRSTIIFAVICAVVVAGYVIALLADRIFGAGSDITRFINRHILNNYGNGNQFIRTAIFIVVGYVIITLLQYFIRIFGIRASKRRQTIVSLFVSITQYIGGAVVLVMLMGVWNVDPTIIAAIIAALGIAIGFGAQNLIGDMLAGLFLIFENALRVGDFITFEDFRGEVIDVGIRATRLRSPAGDVKVINNSELRKFVNMSMHRSTAVCDIPIEYDENLERIEKIINSNLLAIGERIPAITEGPEYKGVIEFNDRGVIIRIVAKCKEEERPQTVRDLNRELKLLFDKNKIKIAVTKREMVTKKG